MIPLPLATPPAPVPAAPPVGDGREDFDFLHGRWRVANRRLTDPTGPGADTWVAFDGSADVRPVLGGLGNVDTFTAPADAAGRPFHGVTLRLFEPGERLWRIWWASAGRPGELDAAMVGRFAGGHGTFRGADTVDGQPVDVRFDWYDGAHAARWEQAFSLDGGQVWTTNWVMELTRADE